MEKKLDGAGDRLLAGEVTGEVLNRAGRLALHALVGAGADVGSDDGVGQFEQRVVGGRRFFVEDIGPVAADLAGLEGRDDIGGVDDFAAGAIEDDDALFHFGE